MSFNFPSPATVGQLYPDPAWEGAVQYKWNGTAWIAQAVSGADQYVKKVGDTMTGVLTAPAYRAPLSGSSILGDITVARAVNSGALYFGTEQTRYLFFDGTQFQMVGGPITAPVKGHKLGTFSTVSAGSAMPKADASVLFYDISAENWAGYGVDGAGNFWLRTGLSGTPAPALWIDTSQSSHFTGPMYVESGLSVSNSAVILNGLWSRVAASPTTGFLYLGNDGAKNLNFDGGAFNFVGAALNVTGQGRIKGSPYAGWYHDTDAGVDRFFVGADIGDIWRVYAAGYGNALTVAIGGAVTIATSLTISNAPTAGAHAANKTYVDNKVAAVPLSSYLPISGGTITGTLTVNSTLVSLANIWAHGGVVYLSNTGGHYLQMSGGVYNVGGQTIYHTGNFNPASYLPTGGGTISGKVTQLGGVATTMAYGGSAGALEVQGAGGGADAMISFHRPGAFGCNFGLCAGGSGPNHFQYGGWSHGSTIYNIYSSAGLMMAMMMRQIAGGLSAVRVPASRSSTRDELKDLLLLAAEHFDEKAKIEENQPRRMTDA